MKATPDLNLPEIISSKNADWHVKTHVSKIYRYGDLALKSIIPVDFIDADTLEKRRQMLSKELEIGKIYNNGDPDNIFKGIVTRKNEDGKDESFLVMKWMPAETRLDALLKNNLATKGQLEKIVTQIFHAHSQITSTGEEIKYYSQKSFPLRFAVNVELARGGIRNILNDTLTKDLEHFERLQNKLVEEIPNNFLKTRITNEYVKFSHADTKSDNIYIRDSNVICLDAVVVKPMWQCVDRIEELAALAVSVFEDGGAKSSSITLDAHRRLDKKLNMETVKFFWTLSANWAFVRGVVSLMHATVKKRDGIDIESYIQKTELCLEHAIKFAEKSLTAHPSFEFE